MRKSKTYPINFIETGRKITLGAVRRSRLFGSFTCLIGKARKEWVYFSLSSTFGLFLCSIVAGWLFNAKNDPFPNVDDREKDS
jgi:hypothetical protein